MCVMICEVQRSSKIPSERFIQLTRKLNSPNHQLPWALCLNIKDLLFYSESFIGSPHWKGFCITHWSVWPLALDRWMTNFSGETFPSLSVPFCVAVGLKQQLITSGLCGLGIWAWLSCVPLAQGLSPGCSQRWSWDGAISRLGWGRIHFTAYSLAVSRIRWQDSVPYWLLAGDISSLLCGPLHWAACNMGPDSLHSKGVREGALGWKPQSIVTSWWKWGPITSATEAGTIEGHWPQ